MKVLQSSIFLILFLCFGILNAQNKESITGTNLVISLVDGAELNETSPILSYQSYDISFLEFAGVNYEKEVKDFENIEKEYAEKGITVSKIEKDKIGIYDSVFVFAGMEDKEMLQIIFGDENFFAIATIISSGTSSSTFNIEDFKKVLQSIEFVEPIDNASILDAKANFRIKNEDSPWHFVKQMSFMFAFEHRENESALLMMQMPPETLLFSSKQELAQQFIEKFKEKNIEFEVIEEGIWTANTIDGYRSILKLKGDSKESLLYLFVFGSEKSTFIMQGMGKEFSEISIREYSTFLEGLELKS